MRQKFFLFKVLSVLSCFLMAAGFSSAQETRDEPDFYSDGVLISLPAAQEGKPGDFLTYVFRLANQTALHKSFTVSVVSTQNWPLLTDKNRIELPPHHEGIFAFSVMIPPATPGGTEDLLQVTFSGSGLTRSHTLTTKVQMIREFTLQVEEKISGVPGETVRIPVLFSNTGSVSESFSLRVASERKWPVSWETDQFLLAPGGKLATFILCPVPASAPKGLAETLHLEVKTAGALHEYQTTVVVSGKTGAAGERELSFPLHSYFSLTFPGLEEQTLALSEASLRLTGDIHDRLWFNFYLAGENEEEGARLSTLLLDLTGNDRSLRAGRFNAGWNGLVRTPTPTAMLYYQEYRNYPLQFWLGSQDEDLFAPAWVGGTLNLPANNMELRMLCPLEQEGEAEEKARFTGALEARMLEPAFLRRHLPTGWESSLTGALGMGEESLLWQGELSLYKRNPVQNFSLSLSGGDEFYHNLENTRRFTALTLSRERLLSDRLSLEHLLDLRLTFDEGDRSFLAPTFQSKVNYDHYYLLFRALHQQVKTAGFAEIGAYHNWGAWQGTAALNYERGFRPLSSDVLSFSGKLRRRFYDLSYVEGFLNHQWSWDNTGGGTSFSTGIRWNYPLFTNLEAYGGLIYSKSGPHDDTSFYSLFSYWLSPKNRLQMRVKSPLAHPGHHLTLQLSFQHRDTFFVAVPWGGVQGRVFLDLNRNRRYDRGEPGVPGVTVFLNGEAKSVTGADGTWIIPRVPAGRHHITLAGGEGEFFFPAAQWEIEITPNRETVLTVPAFSPLQIKGFIYLDEKGNQQPDPADPLLGGVELLLCNEANGEVIARTVSGEDGFFTFSGLIPGEYRIELNRQTLPASAAGPPSLPVVLADHSPPLIAFPVLVKEKEIEFTYIQD